MSLPPFGAPYRPPAPGTWPASRQWFFGGLFQNCRTSDKGIAKWNNTSTVADWHSPPGSPITPYPRPAHAGSMADPWPNDMGPPGNCPGYYAGPPYDCGIAGSGYPACGPWPDTDKPTCPGADSTHFTLDFNCYQKDLVVTVDLSACRKVGFKNVQAMKFWHGRFGYLSHDQACAQSPAMVDKDMGIIQSAACNNCQIEYEQPNADQTKYLQLALAASYSSPGGSHNSSVTITVDRLSGVRTISGCVSDNTSVVSPVDGTTTTTTDAIMDGGFGVCQLSVYTSWNAIINYYVNTIDSICPGGSNCAVVGGDGTNVTFDFYDGCTGASSPCTSGGNHLCSMSMDLATGTMDAFEYTPDGPSGAYVNTYEEHWAMTATTFTHTVTRHLYTAGTHYGDLTETVTGALSVSYTATQCYSDFCDLLNAWSLSDDQVYPWRTDGYLSIAPLVTRNEVPNSSPDYAPTASFCTDAAPALPKSSIAAGGIVGAPLPAGYGPHFDWDHRTWVKCTDTDGLDHPYVKYYGAWCNQAGDTGDATDRVVPITATQWTENWPYPELAPAGGAWLFYKLQGGPACLWGQKWAECRIIRPSYNFARPYGADRYALDEPSCRCVASVSGSGPYTVTLVSASTAVIGDKAMLVSVSGIADGIYTVTGVSGAAVTVTGPNTVSPSWVKPVDAAPGFFGRLRFPTAPAVVTPVAVVEATNAAPIQVTVATPTYLATGDSVTVAGVGGNTAANTTTTVTVIDSTHFTLDGTTGNGAYTSGGTAVTPGAPNVEWDDDGTKGDFVAVEWQCNMRDWQERNRVNTQYTSACNSCATAAPASTTPIRYNQTLHGMPQQVATLLVEDHALKTSVCSPAVLAITPNGETFDNAYVRDWPSRSAPPVTVLPDERYGSQWQAAFIQHLPDYLWEAPHAPCVVGLSGNRVTNCAWLEDSGGCSYGLDGSAAGGVFCGNCIESGDTVTATNPPATPQLNYAQRPWVEARATLPVNSLDTHTAPALPSGIYIGWLTLASLDTAGSVSGNVLIPVDAPGTESGCDPNTPCIPNYVAGTPWQIWLNEIFCVCNSGCFAADYLANRMPPCIP